MSIYVVLVVFHTMEFHVAFQKNEYHAVIKKNEVDLGTDRERSQGTFFKNRKEKKKYRMHIIFL